MGLVERKTVWGRLICFNVITFTFLLLVVSFILGYLQYLIRGRLT